MYLGFEGGFPVLQASINGTLTPHFNDKILNKVYST